VTRVRQVLVNLLSNAVKFTPKGEVFVSVRALSAPPPGAAGQQPWHLHFSVRDTGIGIPVERLARLFRPFTQADVSTARQYGGTGLGLAISKRLVELMGGKMWAESVPEKGSTFHFTLPLPAAAEPPPRPADARPTLLANLRVLIVDDNPTNNRILAYQAGRWGMTARCARSAQQALDWLRAGETFDLAILDMQMPDMDGLMLAREIRRLPGGDALPLVMLTSMPLQTRKPEFQALHFAGCLTKPIKPAQLLETLVRIVSGAARSQTANRAASPARLDPATAGRLPLRVLLCDDNAINQKVAQRILQQLGYRPDVAADGAEALARLDAQPYDLIFMDVLMPGMDGLEATRQIRQRQQHPDQFPNYREPIVIVAMTASAMQGDREKCLAAGMDDYLAKPIRLEDVRRVVEHWGEKIHAARNAMNPNSQPSQPPAHSNGEHAAAPGSNGAPADAPAAANDAPPPVDMARLNDFTDGNPESLRELVTLYLQQTASQIEQLQAAIAAQRAEEVRRLAHSCAGASATCGMQRLAPLLRELEQLGLEGRLATAPQLFQQILAEFQRIREFLAPHLESSQTLASQAAS
jgi:CheY-like chemotaxis protein